MDLLTYLDFLALSKYLHKYVIILDNIDHPTYMLIGTFYRTKLVLMLLFSMVKWWWKYCVKKSGSQEYLDQIAMSWKEKSLNMK